MRRREEEEGTALLSALGRMDIWLWQWRVVVVRCTMGQGCAQRMLVGWPRGTM